MPQNHFDVKSTLFQVIAWQQAITWASVGPELCRHLAAMAHNVNKLV